MKKLLILNGPNLNMLGVREPEIYGTATLAEIEEQAMQEAKLLGLEAVCFQSNSEGKIIDRIQAALSDCSGIVINPGAYTHYSYAIRDAIASVRLPTVEVHISNIYRREGFRNHSVIADTCAGQISGLGAAGYRLAVRYLAEILK